MSCEPISLSYWPKVLLWWVINSWRGQKKKNLKIHFAINIVEISEEHWIWETRPHTYQQIVLSLTEQLHELVPELHNGIPLPQTACQNEWVMLKTLQLQAQLSCWLLYFILSTFSGPFRATKWFPTLLEKKAIQISRLQNPNGRNFNAG